MATKLECLLKDREALLHIIHVKEHFARLLEQEIDELYERLEEMEVKLGQTNH